MNNQPDYFSPAHQWQIIGIAFGCLVLEQIIMGIAAAHTCLNQTWKALMLILATFAGIGLTWKLYQRQQTQYQQIASQKSPARPWYQQLLIVVLTVIIMEVILQTWMQTCMQWWHFKLGLSTNQKSLNAMNQQIVPLGHIVLLLILCVYAPLVEEFFFRFALINQRPPHWQTKMQAWWYGLRAIISIILFTMLHMLGSFYAIFHQVPGHKAALCYVCVYGIMAIVYTGLYLATNNLKLPLAVHICWDLLSFVNNF